MILTESPFPHLDVAQQSSIHRKHEQAGHQGTSMHGITSQPTSTTERGNFTYLQQADTKNLHRQPLTPNIAQCQLKHQWTQQQEYQ